MRDLLAEHPDWIDLPLGILLADGSIDFVGLSGDVMEVECTEDDINDDGHDIPPMGRCVVFVPN